MFFSRNHNRGYGLVSRYGCSSSFGPHHYRSTAQRHLVPKERGLYIVIITEEETGTPRRCERRWLPRIPKLPGPQCKGCRPHRVWPPNGGWCKEVGLVRNTEDIQSGLHGLRQMNNKARLCSRCDTDSTNNMSYFSLQLPSLTAPRTGALWLQTPIPRHILSIMHDASAHIGLADGRWNPVAQKSHDLALNQPTGSRGGRKQAFEEGLQFSQWRKFSWVREWQ